MKRASILFLSAVLVTGLFFVSGRFILGHDRDESKSIPVRGNPLDPKNLPLGDGRTSAEPKKAT